jgi:hypothetical protein
MTIPSRRSAGFQTCCIADIPVGKTSDDKQIKNLRYGRQECLRYQKAREKQFSDELKTPAGAIAWAAQRLQS